MTHDTDLAEKVRELLADESDVIEKGMFGGQAFLIGGNLAVAASGRRGLMVRIDPERADELTTDPRAERMVMRGRQMNGWLRVDVGADDDDLADWVGHGVRYAASLPAK